MNKANIVIVANKEDLASSRAVSDMEMNELSTSSGFKLFSVSAKTGVNCNNFFYSAVATLPVFEDYSDKNTDLVSYLMKENPLQNPENTYLNHSNDVRLESAKDKVANSVSISKEDANLSLKVKENNSIINDNKNEVNASETKSSCKC